MLGRVASALQEGLPYRLLLNHGGCYVKLNSVASHGFVQKGLSLSPSDSPSALGVWRVWRSYLEIPELPVEYARRIWLS